MDIPNKYWFYLFIPLGLARGNFVPAGDFTPCSICHSHAILRHLFVGVPPICHSMEPLKPSLPRFSPLAISDFFRCPKHIGHNKSGVTMVLRYSPALSSMTPLCQGVAPISLCSGILLQVKQPQRLDRFLKVATPKKLFPFYLGCPPSPSFISLKVRQFPTSRNPYIRPQYTSLSSRGGQSHASHPAQVGP